TKIGLKQLGQTVKIQAMRDSKPVTFVTAPASPVAERLAGDSIDQRPAGVTFETLPATAGRPEQVAGVQVARVAENSAAFQEGLRKGDIITAVNRQPVPSLA